MARRNISLPDDLDERARSAQLNVSALAQRAVAEELDRQSRLAYLDAWLDELDAAHGPPTPEAIAEAEAWATTRRPVRARPSGVQATGTVPATTRARRAAG